MTIQERIENVIEETIEVILGDRNDEKIDRINEEIEALGLDQQQVVEKALALVDGRK